jgi:DNA polymerase
VEPGAQRFLPERTSLTALRTAAADCAGCALFVGEAPGDQEDRKGEPFVGPAGRLLHRALADADLDEVPSYLTNAVKHFRFTERGKRRIHQTPTRGQLRACLPWLTAELHAIKPDLVVCLGAIAAHAVFGSDFRLTEHRGELLDPPETTPGSWQVMATVHPSAVLRAQDREQAYADFVHDLKRIPRAGD